MSSDNKSLTIYTERGLTEEEAAIVHNYILRGKPGVAKSASDEIRTLYMGGLTCRQIAEKLAPSYSLDLILFARWHFRWDKEIQDRMDEIARNLPNVLRNTELLSLQTMALTLTASLEKIQQEIVEYKVAGGKIPPALLNSWSQAFTMLTHIRETIESKIPKANLGESQSTPLVSVTVNQAGPAEKPVIEVKQSDAKSALMAKVKRKNEPKQ